MSELIKMGIAKAGVNMPKGILSVDFQYKLPKVQIPMEFTISVLAGESFTIPHLSGYNYDYNVDYGDGTSASVTAWNDSNATHIYTNAGDYTLKIKGVCEAFYVQFYADRLKIKSVVTLGNVTIKTLQFYGCGEMLSFSVGSDFDSTNITSCKDMFYYCSKIVTIDLTNYVTSNNISLARSFQECRKLISIVTAGWDTSNIQSVEGTFELCLLLSDLDVSGFNTANVLTFKSAFYYCTGLSVLDVSGFDTSKCNNFETMFAVMNGVAVLDVSGFDTSKSTSFYYMFYLLNVNILDVSGFDVSLSNNFNAMFRDVNTVTEIDTSAWSIDQPNTTCFEMFKNADTVTSEAQALLFWDNMNITTFTDCFLNNTARYKYIDIPNNWKGL